MIDLINPIHDLVVAGHTFQIGPGATINGVRHVVVNISGPSGSRSAVSIDTQHAITDIFAQIALTRLAP